MHPLSLNLALSDLDCISSRELLAFQEAGMLSLSDVLMRLPRRYEDRRISLSCAELSSGMTACLRVQVLDLGWRFSFKRYFEVVVGDADAGPGARLYLRWFHMPYIAKIIAAGQRLFIYGQIKDYAGKLCIINPDFEVQEEDAGMRLAQLALGGSFEGTSYSEDDMHREVVLPIHADRIVPVYRNISGISARRYRELLYQLCDSLAPDIQDSLYDVASTYPLGAAFLDAHFPAELKLSRKARMRFALRECFEQQFKVRWRRLNAEKLTGQVTAKTRHYLEELLEALPFQLTGAQLRCLAELEEDMRARVPMNRLLQGDVGSGKTLVALGAMLLCYEAGLSAALIAPTQILAEQHYNNFKRLLSKMDIPLSLRTSDRQENSDSDYQAKKKPDASRPRLYVGTHALLYKKNHVAALGLAVIDEQHKFGVAQRERFTNLALLPDVLVMSATPIPRTLTLTLYGDLDVSIIDELPPNRGKVLTALRSASKMSRIVSFMREQLAAGRQIYIVSPLVEDSENRKHASASSELERWRAEFPDESIDLLHGRMSSTEKESIMMRFRANESQILVATTVIEVGVDVPNATIMLINDADSFGLSQLHQLRGRIGRGAHAGYCILLSNVKDGDASFEKLSALCRTSNGFEIAEADFILRGPGDVLGTSQSGLGAILFPEWLRDLRLIHRANGLACDILERDPELSLPEHAMLRDFVAGETAQAVTS